MDDHETESIWPALLSDHRLDDGVFAHAYDVIPPGQRALLKSCIAFLYAAHPVPTLRERACREDYGPAGSVFFRESPASWTLVVIDGSFASSARLLAACLPPLCARVPHVAVLRTGAETPWSHPRTLALALALELAGVEDAFEVRDVCAETLCADLAARLGPGVVVDLCAAPFSPRGVRSVDLVRPAAGKGVALYACEEADWDMETLSFVHQERSIDAYGQTPAPDGCTAKAGGLDAMLAGGYDAVYVPASLAGRAIGASPLVLTPGREPFWLWPDLGRERFLNRRAALFADFSPDLPERP